MAVKKSTKKFSKKHLSGTIERRKKAQKVTKAKIASDKKKQQKADRISAKQAEVDQEMEMEESLNKDKELEDFMGSAPVPKSKPEESDDESSVGDIDEHKADLEALKENDPDFFKYLENNDRQLLDFNPDNIQLSDDDEEAGETDGPIDLDVATLKKWKKQLSDSKSLGTLRNIISAFRAAASVNKDEETEFKYTVSTPAAYSTLISICLNEVPKSFQKICPTEQQKGTSKMIVDTGSKKFRSISRLVKAYAISLISLLDDTTVLKSASSLLEATKNILPYVQSFRKVVKELIKSIADIWSTASDENVRLSAFVCLKYMAENYSDMLENVLRQVYAGLIKQSRKTNIHTIDSINLMKNTAATLFGINETVSYQVAFDSIRQAAIHLRSSFNSSTKESYKSVYNWQYCNSLDFWSRVLSVYCDANKEAETGKQSLLRPLIYPVVQITIGTARLIPTEQYFPLRFYLVRSLIRLSRHSGVYIPLAPILAEVLTSSLFSKKGKQSSLKPLDFDSNIRASQAYLGTKIYRDGVVDQLAELYGEYFVLYCKSIAFPELVIPTTLATRRFIKRNKDVRVNKTLQAVIERLENNSKYILSKRQEVSFSPSNQNQVLSFLDDVEWETTPLGKFIVNKRQIKEEQQRLLREALKDASDDEGDEDMDLDDVEKQLGEVMDDDNDEED
ncbi:hypothetical protein CANCADRAFT_23235 [Tortispora caseinolytica NRRL Y-17796]|uniref:Nucleolar complex protein 2 n=1 Tax=Tortispora caseinolytica NRRL Y-17796 TaxID=767744 RepID=A0A1E4TL03_9ASCO|nr:hypothetical protein CANCADRAFT_23235 [Tortispora caseinolytica NRRL Y-17796]